MNRFNSCLKNITKLNLLVSHVHKVFQEWTINTLTKLNKKVCEIYRGYREARKRLNEESSSFKENSNSVEDSMTEPAKKKVHRSYPEKQEHR